MFVVINKRYTIAISKAIVHLLLIMVYLIRIEYLLYDLQVLIKYYRINKIKKKCIYYISKLVLIPIDNIYIYIYIYNIYL